MPKVEKDQKKTSALLGFDLTIWSQRPREKVCAALSTLAKKWVMQLEETKEGKKHYQARIMLWKRLRKGQVVKLCQQAELECHVSETSTNVHKGNNFNYVMKLDSRVEGPWSDKDVEEKCKITVSSRAEAEISEIEKKLIKWQMAIIISAKTKNRDDINILYDPTGLKGKSEILRLMLARRLALCIPCCDDAMKIIGFAAKMPEADCYIGDMPRSLNKNSKKLQQYFAGIEQLKTGILYDWRYDSEIAIRGRPVIWLFTNNKLPKDAFTQRRMKIWRILDDDLVQVTNYDVLDAPDSASGGAYPAGASQESQPTRLSTPEDDEVLKALGL